MSLGMALEVLFKECTQPAVGSEFDHDGAEIEKDEEAENGSEHEDGYSRHENAADHQSDERHRDGHGDVAAHADDALTPFELTETFRRGIQSMSGLMQSSCPGAEGSALRCALA